MTEASGLIAYDPVAGAGKAGSVGWALPYTRVEVRQLDFVLWAEGWAV